MTFQGIEIMETVGLSPERPLVCPKVLKKKGENVRNKRMDKKQAKTDKTELKQLKKTKQVRLTPIRQV